MIIPQQRQVQKQSNHHNPDDINDLLLWVTLRKNAYFCSERYKLFINHDYNLLTKLIARLSQISKGRSIKLSLIPWQVALIHLNACQFITWKQSEHLASKEMRWGCSTVGRITFSNRSVSIKKQNHS